MRPRWRARRLRPAGPAACPARATRPLLRTLLQQRAATAALTFTAPAHREATRTREPWPRLRRLAREAEPGSDAQLQLVTAFGRPDPRGADDRPRCAALFEGIAALAGPRRSTRTALDAPHRPRRRRRGRRGRDRRRARAATDTADRPRAGRPRPAPPARPPRPRARPGAAPSSEDGLPNSVVDAHRPRLRPGRRRPPSCCGPYVDRYHDAARHGVRPRRSHAIVEALVRRLLPAGRSPTPQLLEATQTWLDAAPGRPAALRRLVAENRDTVVRAVRAQERDARD